MSFSSKSLIMELYSAKKIAENADDIGKPFSDRTKCEEFPLVF